MTPVYTVLKMKQGSAITLPSKLQSQLWLVLVSVGLLVSRTVSLAQTRLNSHVAQPGLEVIIGIPASASQGLEL